MAMGRRRFAILIVGGLVVVLSFTLNAGVVIGGGTPTSFAWPVFLAGMAIGLLAAARALGDTRS
jgi:hypothetical protein